MLLGSCDNNKKELDCQLISSHFKLRGDLNMEFTQQPDSICFTYLPDTIKQNYSLNYTEFTALISKKLGSLDSINTNSKTRKFLKAFYLAEACYALNSGGFLGEKYGLFEDSEIKKNWSQYNLKEQYAFANSNKIRLECGDITNFYRKLLKETTNINSRDTSIIGIHTYPIVSIEDDEYIVDPYDPTLIVSALDSSKPLTFNAIKKNPKLAIPLRVNNTFGEKHYLLSNDLSDNLQAIDSNLHKAIVVFLDSLKNNLKNMPHVSYHLNKNWVIRPVLTNCCRFAFNQVYMPNYNSANGNKNFINRYFGKLPTEKAN